jgi:polysaccharide deacetylase 2 family uncharacterized protein YibQ
MARSKPRFRQLMTAVLGIGLLAAVALTVLLLLPVKRVVAREPPRFNPPRVGCTPKTPCLVVIIDDVGRKIAPLQRLLETKLPLSFSVLPHAAHTKPALALLRDSHARRDIMLHLPMEPRRWSLVTDEPLVLRRGVDPIPVLRAALREVVPVVAINNHMGSGLSEDADAIARLMLVLRRLKIPFVDSRTSPRSMLCRGARLCGVSCLSRDVFLDDPKDPHTVDYRLKEAIKVAKQRGWAIAIGHPAERTIHALKRLSVGFNRLRVVDIKSGPSPRVVGISTLLGSSSARAGTK